uniref:Ig-like domain-containing protein n=1 Tax=Sander lucioperca TaxID=283035 RepID=A0A8C9Z915_SANLU
MLSLQHYVFSLLFLSILTGMLDYAARKGFIPITSECISCEELTPVEKEGNSLEDSSVTLSYRYSKQATSSDYFFWYRQYPGKPPEFIISHSASGGVGDIVIPGLAINVEGKQIHMIISSAKLSDSAVYYCAVQPTKSLEGSSVTLSYRYSKQAE